MYNLHTSPQSLRASTTRRTTPANLCSKFARAAVHDAFGHLARALDYDSFVDRPPDQTPRLIYAPRPAVRLPALGKGCGK